MSDPRISIVTACYQSGDYLDDSIRSILDQDHPATELIVIDGGSTDETIEILKGYEDRLAHWESTPDRGQSHALNKGFARSRGEVMAWINADDILLPGSLGIVDRAFAENPEVQWLTSLYKVHLAPDGSMVQAVADAGYTEASFRRGAHMILSPWFRSVIPSESTFWRRSLWERAGGRVDESFHYQMDYELWSRFFEHAELVSIEAPLGAMRIVPEMKSARDFDVHIDETDRYLGPGRVRLDPPLTWRAKRRAIELLRSSLMRGSHGLPPGLRWLGEAAPIIRYSIAEDRWERSERWVV